MPIFRFFLKTKAPSLPKISFPLQETCTEKIVEISMAPDKKIHQPFSTILPVSAKGAQVTHQIFQISSKKRTQPLRMCLF